MRIFISGGAKNGKSYYAQCLAKAQQRAGKPLYYIAAMRPVDGEDEARVARHLLDRAGWGFTTVEQPENMHGILDKCDHGGSFLLDSTTALLANEMFSADGAINENAPQKAAESLRRVLSRIADIVVVSDYIYGDAMLFDDVTERYRGGLASVDRLAAQRCDAVLEAVYGNIIVHRGAAPFRQLREKAGAVRHDLENRGKEKCFL